MTGYALKTYAKDNGGRVSLLVLLFLLAIYEFITAGFAFFAIICIIPILVLMMILAFRHGMLCFWALFSINYLIQWKSFPAIGLPMSVPNELLEIVLIAMAVLDMKERKFYRAANVMGLALIVWALFCTLEVLNDTCGIGIDVAAWFTTARSLAYQLLYGFLVYSIYISTPKVLVKYLYIWGGFALFAVFWVWKQKNFGMTPAENSFLQGRGRLTHLLQGGSLIRYFSIYGDAANFGIGIASTAVAFLAAGITAKIKRLKYFFLIVGFACVWGMFPSGTRTAIVCLMAGVMMYVFLSKSFKIAVPVTLTFAILAFLLMFTTIGNGNQQIRRMRSAFDKNDASANQRSINQAAMKKYLAEAPWGIGMAVGYKNVPANNKFTFMATVPPDSEYVFIWIHTGIIGITVFLVCQALMLFGACWIVLFSLKSSSLRGIGAGLCCAFAAQQLGGYGNQTLLQFPNCLIFYGGLAIVYILPHLENEWIEYEQQQIALEEEKKRLKLEKKRASRV